MKDLGHAMTVEEFVHLSSDGGRRELVRGEVREMVPAGGEHGWVTGNVLAHLHAFVHPRRLGRLFAAETGFVLERGPDTVRAPDCAFVSFARLSGELPRGFVEVVPELVVETASPDDRPRDVAEKIAQWLGAGVQMVWLIEPARRTVTVHQSAAEVFDEKRTLDGGSVLPGLRLPVREIFA